MNWRYKLLTIWCSVQSTLFKLFIHFPLFIIGSRQMITAIFVNNLFKIIQNIRQKPLKIKNKNHPQYWLPAYLDDIDNHPERSRYFAYFLSIIHLSSGQYVFLTTSNDNETPWTILYYSVVFFILGNSIRETV